ncbi:MAG: hypothetical protein M1540_00245 [Candidatus Bathyarchaeota archaeon]|nr:hypothetical protein [Candidatus Bathyarchaeota archaeon]
MPKNPTGPFWFIRDGNKLIQCTKETFDKAITEGKSVKYNGYPNKRAEKIAEALEASRMLLLSKPELPTKFRAVLTNPANVVQIQVIDVEDPEFWLRESKNPKYQKQLRT